jgi:YegS/Rv2252/BmrU family lipid kinase
VYSVGGDGTLNEVLNGLAGSGSSLAIIPAGSGNDFVRSLDEGGNPFKALHETIDGFEKLVDLGTINGRYFINISSIGFDAEVADSASRIKKIPLVSGSMAYFLGIFYTLIRYSNNIINIDIDGMKFDQEVLLVAVANGRYYGGGMMAAPKAVIDDGLFDICLIERMKRPKILHFFPKFIKGLHSTIDGVHFYRGKRVVISSKRPLFLNTDGDVRSVTNAVFEIIPNGIKVVFPFCAI